MASPAACRIAPARMCSTLSKGHPGMAKDPADAIPSLTRRPRFLRNFAFKCFTLQCYTTTHSMSSPRKSIARKVCRDHWHKCSTIIPQRVGSRCIDSTWIKSTIPIICPRRHMANQLCSPAH